MKNKAPLALMEQVIMLLVLAVAAAICLQIFTQAHLTAKQNHLQDEALSLVQSTAEILKSTGDLAQAAQLSGGSYKDGVLTIEKPAFTVTAKIVESGKPFLGMAKITATDGKSTLAQMQICWQEVSP